MPKILIVDDEIHIRLLLEQTLEIIENNDLELLMATNGDEALSMIEENNPDIVFLDLMIPGLNGFEICNIVKQNLKLKTNIIFLTAKGQEIDRQQGINSGADMYITKPFNPDEIVEIVKKKLNIL